MFVDRDVDIIYRVLGIVFVNYFEIFDVWIFWIYMEVNMVV